AVMLGFGSTSPYSAPSSTGLRRRGGVQSTAYRCTAEIGCRSGPLLLRCPLVRFFTPLYRHAALRDARESCTRALHYRRWNMVASLFRKLDVGSRAELVARLQEEPR